MSQRIVQTKATLTHIYTPRLKTTAMRRRYNTCIISSVLSLALMLCSCSYLSDDINNDPPPPGQHEIDEYDGYPIKTMSISDVASENCDELYILSLKKEACSEYTATNLKDWIYVFNPYDSQNDKEYFLVSEPEYDTFEAIYYSSNDKKQTNRFLLPTGYYSEIWKLASLSSEDNPLVFITTDCMDYAIINGKAYYYDRIIRNGLHTSLPDPDFSGYKTEVICLRKSKSIGSAWEKELTDCYG